MQVFFPFNWPNVTTGKHHIIDPLLVILINIIYIVQYSLTDLMTVVAHLPQDFLSISEQALLEPKD